MQSKVLHVVWIKKKIEYHGPNIKQNLAKISKYYKNIKSVGKENAGNVGHQKDQIFDL